MSFRKFVERFNIGDSIMIKSEAQLIEDDAYERVDLGDGVGWASKDSRIGVQFSLNPTIYVPLGTAGKLVDYRFVKYQGHYYPSGITEGCIFDLEILGTKLSFFHTSLDLYHRHGNHRVTYDYNLKKEVYL